MANGLIDFTSPAALADADKLIAKAKELNVEIEKANRNAVGLTGRGNRDQLRDIEALNRELAEQSTTINRLSETRARAGQRTQEEITNNRLLAQNANLAARANSTFANSYQRLTAQQAISAGRVQDLIARGRTAEQTQRQYNRELRNAQSEFDKLNARVLSADTAVGKFNRNVGNYPGRAISGLKDLIGAFGVVGGVTAFAAITRDIFNTTRELQSLDLALKNVTGTQENFVATQEFLLRISEAYGIEINGLTKAYTGFLAASQNAIESGDITARQIQEIFESVSKASGAMGLSVEQQQGAFLALQQMISKGNVQAEEIRGQLAERLPGAFGILAKSMGVTEQVLNKMLKDGQVMAAEVLPAFARELEKAYGVENLDRVEGLAASTTRLSNAWTNLIREMNEGNGVVSQFFTWFVDGAAQALTAIGKLIQSRDSLLKGMANDATANARANTAKFISQSAGDSGSMEDWAKAIKNKVLPQIAELEEKLSQSQYLLRTSDDEIWKFFDPAKWSQHSRAKENIEKYTEELGRLKGELQAADEVLKKTNTTTETTTVLTEEQLKALEKLRKERAKAAEEELQNQYRLQKMRLESEANSFDDIMNDVSLYYSERENAAADLSAKEIAIATLTREENLRRAKNNQTLQLIAWEEYYKDFEKIIKDGEARAKKLREDAFDEFVAYRQKYEGDGLRVLDRNELRDSFFAKQAEDAEKLKQKLKELRDATDEYIRSISIGFLSDAGLGSLNTFLSLDENGQSPFDKLIEGADTFGEKFAVTFNAIAEVAKETFAFINQNSQAAFDAEYSRIERQKDIALSFAGQTQEGRAEIERQYEEKRREIRRRELQAQKEQALFNIALNTAQGVTAALTSLPPNIPLSIVIGAIGSAQAALVASREIPAYKFGTDNHPGGAAIVGDGGKHELIHQPKLGWSISPNKSTLVNLEPGTKVYPDLAKSGVFNSSLPDMVKLNGSGMSPNQMDQIAERVAGRVPVSNTHINFDKNGFNMRMEEGHSAMILRNSSLGIKNGKVGRS